MYQNAPFSCKKIVNFLARGTAPPQTSLLGMGIPPPYASPPSRPSTPLFWNDEIKGGHPKAK